MDPTEYEPVFAESFVRELNRLDNCVREIAEKKILKAIESPLLGKPLHGEPFLFSERFLQYRLVYKIDGKKIIFLKLGKRDAIYRF